MLPLLEVELFHIFINHLSLRKSTIRNKNLNKSKFVNLLTELSLLYSSLLLNLIYYNKFEIDLSIIKKNYFYKVKIFILEIKLFFYFWKFSFLLNFYLICLIIWNQSTFFLFKYLKNLNCLEFQLVHIIFYFIILISFIFYINIDILLYSFYLF